MKYALKKLQKLYLDKTTNYLKQWEKYQAMPVFKDMLKSSETLFKNATALDYDYVPKIIPHRENEQQAIAACIRPLFSKRNGRNMLVYGASGAGKTVACRKILEELEDESDDITPIYVNCWKKNTSYKILLEACETLGYKFTQNKKTEELFEIVKKMVNAKSAVFVFDEVDKLEDYDFLYFIAEDIYRKSMILITNFKEWVLQLDSRIKSRISAEMLEFKPYGRREIEGILRQRLDYAFYDGVFCNDAFKMVIDKTAEIGDIRAGLYFMREAGNLAEEKSSKQIQAEHVKKAIEKSDEFSIKKPNELEEEARIVLEIAKQNPESKIGDLYRIYQEKGGNAGYKTFQRKIESLAKNKFVTATKITGGKDGTTTVVSTKKITDFSK